MLFGRIWERLGVADVLTHLLKGARVRGFGRARRVRRRAASAIRLGIGSRLLVVDGGLRHPRRPKGSICITSTAAMAWLGEEVEEKPEEALVAAAASRT